MLELKLLKEKDMKKLDDEIELIPLTFDFIFKGIFMNDLDLLKEFLLLQLQIDLELKYCNIELLTNELPKENKKEYKKTVDIYVRINDYIYVNIEVNREYFEDIKLRNMLFADKLYSMILETGESSKKLNNRYFVQINLNAIDKLDYNKNKLKYGTDRIVTFGLDSKQIYTKNKYMLVKYLEYYRDLYYNKHEKLSNSEMWLVMLTSKNFQELFETSGHILDDKRRDDYIRKVIKMCSDKFVISEWYMRKLDEVVEGTKIYNEQQREKKWKQREMEFARKEDEFTKKENEFNKKENEFNKKENEFNKKENEFNKKEKELKEKERTLLELERKLKEKALSIK